MVCVMANVWSPTGTFIQRSTLHATTWTPVIPGDLEGEYLSGPKTMAQAWLVAEMVDPDSERYRWMRVGPDTYELQIAALP